MSARDHNRPEFFFATCQKLNVKGWPAFLPRFVGGSAGRIPIWESSILMIMMGMGEMRAGCEAI